VPQARSSAVPGAVRSSTATKSGVGATAKSSDGRCRDLYRCSQSRISIIPGLLRARKTIASHKNKCLFYGAQKCYFGAVRLPIKESMLQSTMQVVRFALLALTSVFFLVDSFAVIPGLQRGRKQRHGSTTLYSVYVIASVKADLLERRAQVFGVLATAKPAPETERR